MLVKKNFYFNACLDSRVPSLDTMTFYSIFIACRQFGISLLCISELVLIMAMLLRILLLLVDSCS